MINGFLLLSALRGSTGITLIDALEKLDFSPLAVVTVETLSSSMYSAKVNAGWWQGEYVLEAASWHHLSPIRGAFSGMTSAEFSERYRARSGGNKVSYKGAAQFGAACALVSAIEAAGTVDTAAVAAKMRTQTLSEFYGDIGFDANGQNTQGSVLLQYVRGTVMHVHTGGMDGGGGGGEGGRLVFQRNIPAPTTTAAWELTHLGTNTQIRSDSSPSTIATPALKSRFTDMDAIRKRLESLPRPMLSRSPSFSLPQLGHSAVATAEARAPQTMDSALRRVYVSATWAGWVTTVRVVVAAEAAFAKASCPK